MATEPQADFSFVHQGRPLGAWMIDLVSDEVAGRRRAGDVIHHAWLASPVYRTRQDWEGRFDRAVREAVEAPGFPKADFVRRLLVHRTALEEACTAATPEVRREMGISQPDSAARLERRLRAAGDAPERAEAAVARFLAYLADMHDGSEIPEDRSSAEMASGIILEALDADLLVDRPLLRASMKHKFMDQYVLRALERIGPPAVDFAPTLLTRLKNPRNRVLSPEIRALGSIGRDDPGVIDVLVRRLREGSPRIQDRACECLAAAGPPLAGRVDEVVAILIEATRSEAGLRCAVVQALGSVGRRRIDALERLMELATPRKRQEEGEPDFDRGWALSALGHFPEFAERVVPALVEAFDSFRDVDSVWRDGGEHHGVVCDALAAIGPAAAPAIPRLVAYLESWRESRDDWSWPNVVFDALAAMGPRAAAALPTLEAMRTGSFAGEATPPPMDLDEGLDRAILAIRGVIARPTFRAWGG